MFKIDMHVHSILGGDSIIKLEEVVPAAIQVGLDAVCITEHHSFELSVPFDAVSRETGFPILRGMEYKAEEGHLLVFGVNMSRSDMPPQMPMQQVIDWVDRHGGVSVPAHPYQPDMFGGCLGDRLLGLKYVTAVEAMNGSATSSENSMAEAAAEKMGCKMIGGSDAHGPAGIGRAFTIFENRLETVEELVDALKKGAYSPQYGNDRNRKNKPAGERIF